MEKRKLGRSGLDIAPVVFGGNVFGWSVDQARANALLDRFVDLGFNAIDTANSYPRWVPNSSRRRIGNHHRQMAEDERQTRPRSDLHQGGLRNVGGQEGPVAPSHHRRVRRRLKRLGIDTIDLYQSHRDDTSTPMEETLRPMPN